MQQFVDEHPECPDISLRAVDVLNESFRGHVDGRTDVDVLKFTLGQLGEPKIGQFGLAIVYEYVSDLQVPVDYVIFREIKQPLEDVLNIALGLMLLQGTFTSNLALQIPLITQFGDDIAIAVAGEDLVTP